MAEDYDQHSAYQRRVVDEGASLVEQCVEAIALPDPPAPVVVVDLGASTGRNSLAALGTAVRAIRARRAGQPVVCVHEDVATNDWNALFENVRSAPDGYGSLPDVLPMAAARSFFEPAVPPGTAHLEVSYSAAHWLRDQPEVGPIDGFYACEATGDAGAALAAAAAADWTAFVDARAVDLAPGGRLLVQCVGTHGDDVTARALLAAMAEVAQELADDGALDQGAVDRYVFPVYPRRVDEARAGLDDRFEIIDVSTAPVANPYEEQWHRDGDAAAYARSYAAFVQGFAGSTLRQHLLGDVTDEFFARLETRFASDPERDVFRDWTLTVVARRR